MLLLDLSGCGPSGLLRVIYFFKLLLDVVFIIIPIALIVILIIDFSKAALSSDEVAQKKTFKLATKRVLYAVIAFFVPTIVSIFNNILGDLGVDYSKCYNDITIEALDQLEAEEKVEEEADRAARMALLEKEKKQKEKKENTEKLLESNSVYKASGKGCDGMVYYENGNFYKPTSDTSGSSGTKGSASYGYNKYFYDMLSKMIQDAKAEGYIISAATYEYGAWRSFSQQQELYSCYINQNCNKGNLAAEPGTSIHGWGIASDLSFDNDEAKKWAHANASNYSLEFSIDSEDWHIVPISIISDDSVVNKCKK